MRILIADDLVLERELLVHFLISKGHDVAEAGDGQQAVDAVARERFDLVCLDNVMPLMVGNEAVRQIRKRDKQLGHYTPVLFISSLDDSSEIVASLAFGADDYLIKPINLDILEAKLRVFGRIAAQHRVLEQYRLASEDDKAFGRHVLDHLTRTSRGFSQEVRHFTRPHDQLGGDLFAAARAPDGTIHALLADAMGHGLAASLATVVLAQVFYAMVERNQPFVTIISEANAKLKMLLPAGFFVAAAFVRADLPPRRVQIWNGGIPIVRLHSRAGVLKNFPSAHPPLSVLAPLEFDAGTEEYQSAVPSQLLLATDGATEALEDELSGESNLKFDELIQLISDVPTHDDATVAALELL
jgi:DNA-binding response OmpR family regulator